MKYMGSKRSMLQNGLGSLLREQLAKSERFVDLFCGSGSVSWFAATEASLPVFSVDLQAYATSLAAAVTERTDPIDIAEIEQEWIAKVTRWVSSQPEWESFDNYDASAQDTKHWVLKSREIAHNQRGIISKSYGGHYFSLSQSLILDGMLECLPNDEELRKVCLAATIIAASNCAASPGHTAQPFQPTPTAAPFIKIAWKRNPYEHASQALTDLCSMHASVKGKALVCDAVGFSKILNPKDLVFVDPPYSAVHYSRFYHVLETIARGRCSEVSGRGRYPCKEERPFSSFSVKTEAKSALQALLEKLAEARCTVVLTFPAGLCSNGLSGVDIKELAREVKFSVVKQEIKSRFSTLGGNNRNRNARLASQELILLLRPKQCSRNVQFLKAS